MYLVGASAPADRIALESHLGSCPGCRDELADLAGLPALLGRVPPDDVEQLAREDDISLLAEQPLRALLSQVAKRRRQRALAIAAAAVAVGLLAGMAAASAALPRAAPVCARAQPPLSRLGGRIYDQNVPARCACGHMRAQNRPIPGT